MTEAGIILLAYLIGSIPMAYLVGRRARSLDIRRYGSGNAGASNIWVHVGKRVAILLGVFDVFVKGAFPVFLAERIGAGPWIVVMAGLATMVGHNWSTYLRFTGGRGVTVALGVLLVLAWKELAALVAVGLVGWLIFRSSALWVGIAIALTPVWSIILGEPLHITVLCTAIVVVLAAKRLLPNNFSAHEGDLRKVLIHRLLYDRDISSRDEWVYRTPTETRGDG